MAVCSNGNNNSVNYNGGGKEESVVGPIQSALLHNPGLSRGWTPEEESRLEVLLAKYVFETNVVRFAKSAQVFRDKTVRDVALRRRWMTVKKENSKKRKYERKNKEKKEKIDSLPESSEVSSRPNGPPYVQSTMSMDSDDGISYKAIGGAYILLEQNALALDQISTNFSAGKIHENIDLFCLARKNILSILNDFNDTPEMMNRMPPLPVKLNEELANSILPRTSWDHHSRSRS